MNSAPSALKGSFYFIKRPASIKRGCPARVGRAVVRQIKAPSLPSLGTACLYLTTLYSRGPYLTLLQVIDECVYRGLAQSITEEGLFAPADVKLDVTRGRMYKVRLPTRVPCMLTKPDNLVSG